MIRVRRGERGTEVTFHFHAGLRSGCRWGSTVMPFLLKYIEGKQAGALVVRSRKSA